MRRTFPSMPGLLTVAVQSTLCAWPGEDGQPEPEPSLRDVLGDAIDADAGEGGDDGNTGDGNAPPEGGTTPPAEPGAGPQRDAQGRFVSKDGGPATGTPQPGTGQPPAAPVVGQPAPNGAAGQPQPGALPPPGGWTPAAKETWGQVPLAAQQEVTRREREMAQAMQENASARNIAQAFSEAVTPFMARIRMQGLNPVEAVQNLLVTEMTLGQGTMQQRAETIARLVKAYGVDLRTLDNVLAGEEPPQNAQVDAQVQALVAQQLAPYQQFMQQFQQVQAAGLERLQGSVATELEAFEADPKNEFYQHVKGYMADMLDVAAKNGVTLTMQEAYDRAVLIHPQTKEVVAARQRAQAAQGLNGAAQRARRAAASVTGAPAMGHPDDAAPGDLSLREAIAASIDANARV